MCAGLCVLNKRKLYVNDELFVNLKVKLRYNSWKRCYPLLFVGVLALCKTLVSSASTKR